MGEQFPVAGIRNDLALRWSQRVVVAMWLAAAHAPAGSLIRLRGGRDGTKVVLALQDGGPGIPPEARDRIFERYLRLDPHARPVAGGLGLGLYIARRLTDANDGELVCTDPPGGRGACFELRLPIARPALA